MRRKIAFLEANEIPFPIFDDYIASRPNSKLARSVPRCRQYTTRTPDTCRLSPWITWPTLHRGVNNEKHRLLSFGQSHAEADAAYPPVWQLLVDRGLSAGVFGPLHTWPLPEHPENYAFFLPDTFASTPESYPEVLTSFQKFNLIMARRSPRNVSAAVDIRSLTPFLLRAPRLGLRAKTSVAIARHPIGERRQTWKRARRRTFQPVLAFDLYMKQLEQHRPDFSNFFTNHVASAMHRFWAARYPDQYEQLELSQEWQQRYSGEIFFAMDWLDDMFGRLIAFAHRNPDYLIVTASSMGQAAASGQRIANQLYLREPAKLMGHAGLTPADWSQRPAMDPTVSLLVSAEKAGQLGQYLSRLSIDGEPIRVSVRHETLFDIALGQSNLEPRSDLVTQNRVPIPYSELGFELVEIEDEAGSTGYHVPEGSLLIYDPGDASIKDGSRPTVSTTDVAPAILANFGMEIPDYMNAPGAIPL